MSAGAAALLPAPSRRGGRIALAALLLVPLVFLFAPTVPDSECLRTLNLAGYARITHNCDTPSLVNATLNLEQYVLEDNPWRTRPVYILAGAAASFALEPVAVLLRPVLSRHLQGSYPVDKILGRLPNYLGLGLLNLVMLAVAIRLGAALFGGMAAPLAIGLGAAFATSDIVHGMVWAPHPSFMNVLIPAGCIFAFIQGARVRLTGWRDALLFGLAVSAAVLSYGYALIWIVAMVAGWLFMAWRDGRPLPALAEVPRIAVFLAAACLPTLLWTGFTRLYLELPVSYEAGLHQFVWLWEAARAGLPALTAAVAEKGRLFTASLGHSLLPFALYPLAATALLLLAGAHTGTRDLTVRRIVRDPVLAAVLVCLLSMLAFNFLQGYYQPRLQQPLILALFVAVARAAQLARLEAIGTALLLAGAALQLWLAFQGPALTQT